MAAGDNLKKGRPPGAPFFLAVRLVALKLLIDGTELFIDDCVCARDIV